LSIILSAIETSTVTIRDLELLSEIREIEALQKDVWGIDDLDVVPLTMLVASREVGAVLIGAYDRSTLVGFVYGFPGYENGHLIHHSHMLAVKQSYRNTNLGYKLKLAQRERVLAQGIKRITWTFDPLQSLNAYFNFAKLGVVADTYKINFYGEATSSFLHQIGTDRLWVTWLLESQRVRERLQTETKKKEQRFELENIPSLVEIDPNGAPQRKESSEVLGEQYLLIEIPADINALQEAQPQLAMKWREATRWAFTEAMTSGYIVEVFDRSIRNDQSVGIYLLSSEDVSGVFLTAEGAEDFRGRARKGMLSRHPPRQPLRPLR
jgi:predicted GNAT superfamily acetyltransferase